MNATQAGAQVGAMDGKRTDGDAARPAARAGEPSPAAGNRAAGGTPGSAGAPRDRGRQAQDAAADAVGSRTSGVARIERRLAGAGKLVRENPAAAAGIAFAAGALAALLLRR